MAPCGGRRAGAGRLKSEPTKVVRLPISLISGLDRLKEQFSYQLPVFSSKVQAGFPSPADDYIEGYLDLNHHLIKHPAASFFVTATGDSMIDAGIHSGDLLLVDKSLKAHHGAIVIAALNGELTVKRLSSVKGRVQLIPENPNYKAIDITDTQDLVIWGVVTHVIHNL